jgi:hypothetical protein
MNGRRSAQHSLEVNLEPDWLGLQKEYIVVSQQSVSLFLVVGHKLRPMDLRNFPSKYILAAAHFKEAECVSNNACNKQDFVSNV